MTPLLLCLDIGFAATGFGIVSLTSSFEQVRRMGLVQTASETDRRKVVDDDVRRTRELFHAFNALLQVPDDFPDDARFVAICAEAYSEGAGAGGAKTARKVALAWGAIVCTAEVHHLPLLQASPQDARKALGLKPPTIVKGEDPKIRKALGKKAVRAAILERYGNLDPFLVGIPERKLEHPFDALAAGVALLDNDLVRGMRLA